jgi:hypothetical protein
MLNVDITEMVVTYFKSLFQHLFSKDRSRNLLTDLGNDGGMTLQIEVIFLRNRIRRWNNVT